MRYDMNLLRAFDALYVERNVTRAAGRVGISQPAMSLALSRLRDLFNDPLFVRERFGVKPTEKAIQLHPTITQALGDLDAMVYEQQSFDPTTSTRSFDIAANDYFECVILPGLLPILRDKAPGIVLQLHGVTHDVTESGILSGQIDFVFSRVTDAPDNLILREAAWDRFVCIVCAKHPSIEDSISLEQYQRYGHVVVIPNRNLKTGVFKVLQGQKIQRRTACAVTHFFAVPSLIKNSDWIATLPERVCHILQQEHDIKILPTPIDLPDFPGHLAWHQRNQKDPAHQWFRQLVLDYCKNL